MGKQNITKTQRGKDTREQILKSTYDLFKKQNLFSITLDQISEMVGVAKTSILWHFGSKEMLFFELGEYVLKKYEEKAIEKFAKNIGSTLKVEIFLNDYMEIIHEDHEIIEIFFSLLFDKKIADKSRESAKRMYAQWRQLGAKHLPMPAKTSEELATAIIALVDGIYIQWLIDPDNVDIKAVFNTLVKLIKKYEG